MMRICWLTVLGLVLGMAGCQPVQPAGQNVVVSGSVFMAPLVQEMADRFEKAHPGARIDIQRGLTDRGITETQRGLADVGMVARELRASELDLHAFPIARDGLALVVHNSNPMTSLSGDQVVRIFTHQLRSWKEVGGPNLPIVVATPAEGHALLTLFLERFNLKASQVRGDRTVSSSVECMRLVARHPEVIGLASISAREGPDSDPGVHVLAYEGVAGTLDNVKNGSYLLSRPLLLVTRDEPTGLVKELVEYARSPAVADLVEKMHCVPLTVSEPPKRLKEPVALQPRRDRSTGQADKAPPKE